jgi:hypothetical protein
MGISLRCSSSGPTAFTRLPPKPGRYGSVNGVKVTAHAGLVCTLGAVGTSAWSLNSNVRGCEVLGEVLVAMVSALDRLPSSSKSCSRTS